MQRSVGPSFSANKSEPRMGSSYFWSVATMRLEDQHCHFHINCTLVLYRSQTFQCNQFTEESELGAVQTSNHSAFLQSLRTTVLCHRFLSP